MSAMRHPNWALAWLEKEEAELRDELLRLEREHNPDAVAGPELLATVPMPADERKRGRWYKREHLAYAIQLIGGLRERLKGAPYSDVAFFAQAYFFGRNHAMANVLLDAETGRKLRQAARRGGRPPDYNRAKIRELDTWYHREYAGKLTHREIHRRVAGEVGCSYKTVERLCTAPRGHRDP